MQGENVEIRVILTTITNTRKGLRQGDLVSYASISKLICCLSLLRGQRRMTKTHISHLVEEGVFILQYVDDTILFIKHD
jgi:hypothetical protein